MKAFIAVVSENKFQDFDVEADADAHIATFGGFVASNPGDQIDYWQVDMTAKTLDIDTAQYDADRLITTNTAYQRERAEAFPAIRDQLDALWKGGQAQTDMKVLIDGVKAAHPKPGE